MSSLNMKIIFICHKIPYPPNKGEKVRAFNIIRHLSKGHDICLVSLYDGKGDPAYKPELGELCKEVYLFPINRLVGKIKAALYLLSGIPATIGYFHSRKMKAKIEELIRSQRFDLVFAYSSSMAQYVMNADIQKIMDFVDCDSAKWGQYSKIAGFPLSLVYAREHDLLQEYEKKIAEKFDKLLVVTEAEKKEFFSFIATDKFMVIQNGVDTDFFRFSPHGEQKRLIFTGAMDYFANIDGVSYFCKEIFPLIKKAHPDAEFYIVGHRPTASVRALAGIEGVKVTGSVADIREYLSGASVCVVPLRIAQGVQNKILEAMASGLPVVTTSKVLSGVNAQPGKDLLVADESSDFAEKVNALLESAALRQEIGDNARKYVIENHNWDKNLDKLDGMINGLVRH